MRQTVSVKLIHAKLTRTLCGKEKPPSALTRRRLVLFIIIGAPGRIRTHDPLVRSQVLYPTELRALKLVIARKIGRSRSRIFRT